MSIRFTRETAQAIAPGMALKFHGHHEADVHCAYCKPRPIQAFVRGVRRMEGFVTGVAVNSACCHGVSFGWMDASWFSADWLSAAP